MHLLILKKWLSTTSQLQQRNIEIFLGNVIGIEFSMKTYISYNYKGSSASCKSLKGECVNVWQVHNLKTTCEVCCILFWRFYLLVLIFRSQEVWSNFEALSCYQIRRLPPIPFDKLKLVTSCDHYVMNNVGCLKLVWND